MSSGSGSRRAGRTLRQLAVWLVALSSLSPAANAARPRTVEPSQEGRLLALWARPTVRTGPERKVVDSLGTAALVRPPANGPVPALVLLGTAEGEVLAVVQGSGALAWRYRHGVAIDGVVSVLAPSALGLGEASWPAVAIVCGRDGVLVALDVADGRVRWKTTLDAPSRAAAVAVGRRLYVTTEANQVVALDGATGRILWAQGRPPSTGLALLGHGRPVLAGPRVLAAFADGFVVALDAHDGRVLWERPLSLRGGRFVDADADPVVVGETVFVASVTDGIYALDVATGQTRWQQPVAEVLDLCALPGEPSAGPDAGLLVAGDVYGRVRALRQRDGHPVWQLDAGKGPAVGLAPLLDGVVFLAGERGLVWADAGNGRPRSVHPLGGEPGGGLTVAGDLAAHVARRGELFLLQAQPAASRVGRAPGS